MIGRITQKPFTMNEGVVQGGLLGIYVLQKNVQGILVKPLLN